MGGDAYLAANPTTVPAPVEELEFQNDDDGSVLATAPGVHAAGSGKDEAEATLSLALLLASFVRGHAATIDRLRALMLKAGVKENDVPEGMPEPTTKEGG